MKVIRQMAKRFVSQRPEGLFILGYISSDDYLLHRTEHSAIISAVLGYVSFSQVGIIVPDNSIKLNIISFPFLLNKDFNPKCHLFKFVLLCQTTLISS